MNSFFRKLPLPAKLGMIGVVPLIFLVVLSWELYIEKLKKLQLLEAYMNRINHSAQINDLIDNLQWERWYSYEYAMKKTNSDEMLEQRPAVDSILRLLDASRDIALKKFRDYTFLNDLEQTRTSIDSGRINHSGVMHFYTNLIFRLNTLNTTPPESDVYLLPVNNDLAGQKVLSEMITYLGILRANIYNVLTTRQYMLEVLMYTRGVHQVYQSYAVEFLIKGSDASIMKFKKMKQAGPFQRTNDYIDSLYKRLRFDSTYNAESWAKVSDSGVSEIKALQQGIWTNVQSNINDIYKSERALRNNTLLFLILGLLFAVTVVLFVIRIITKTLDELKIAAEKIAMGATGVNLKVISDDAIGSLTDSIARIDENYRRLAQAADSIGRGNFDVEIKPRGENDILGNAILTMKYSLQRFTSEIESLLYKKDEFMSIASHELKTPITSVKAALQIVERFTASRDDMKDVYKFVETGVRQTTRLTNIVNDLLDVSKIQAGKLELSRSVFLVRELIDETLEQLQFEFQTHEIIVSGNTGVTINADKHRLEQVMINLLTNGIKYSPGADKIIINIEPSGDHVHFSITDFGIGIEQSKLPFVFDRYFRVEQSSQNFSGLGLGLFISSEIVKRHNGGIGVESKIGQGSTFWFTIPSGM